MMTDTVTKGAPTVIAGETYYGATDAAKYLGMARDTFKGHARRYPDRLPALRRPLTGRRAWTQATLDRYRKEWLTPT